jgi:sugar transferase (PEP-CTERM/EpsH1 system associated)
VKVLFLSPRQCWPARSGAKLREYHFARALGERHDLTYLYFADPGADPLTTTDLPFCREVISVPKPGAYTPLQLVQGIAGEWPLPILNYTSAAMDAAVNRTLADTRYHLIHADSIHMTRYARAAHRTSSAKVVYNWHNIESEAMRRFGATVDSPFKRWYARRTSGKLEALERAILHSALGHVVCSERERAELHSWAPKARIHVAENGVDTEYFAATVPFPPEPRLVFVGSMDYFPNIDAALHFTRTLWPKLREHIPELTLTIVGARPAPEVAALSGLPGVTVTGTVADVRPFYANALAAIVPLRTGGGTRLKILEAMAAGVPVVSTELGAEGLAVNPGSDILIAPPDSPDAWLAHIRQLLHEPNSRASIVATSRRLVQNRYDWNLIGASLAARYDRWLTEAP